MTETETPIASADVPDHYAHLLDAFPLDALPSDVRELRAVTWRLFASLLAHAHPLAMPELHDAIWPVAPTWGSHHTAAAHHLNDDDAIRAAVSDDASAWQDAYRALADVAARDMVDLYAQRAATPPAVARRRRIVVPIYDANGVVVQTDVRYAEESEP